VQIKFSNLIKKYRQTNHYEEVPHATALWGKKKFGWKFKQLLQALQIVFKILSTKPYDSISPLWEYAAKDNCIILIYSEVHLAWDGRRKRQHATVCFGLGAFRTTDHVVCATLYALACSMWLQLILANHGHQITNWKDIVWWHMVRVLLQLFPIKTELLHKRRLAQKCNLETSSRKYEQQLSIMKQIRSW
jgi:hypothetical protein